MLPDERPPADIDCIGVQGAEDPAAPNRDLTAASAERVGPAYSSRQMLVLVAFMACSLAYFVPEALGEAHIGLVQPVLWCKSSEFFLQLQTAYGIGATVICWIILEGTNDVASGTNINHHWVNGTTLRFELVLIVAFILCGLMYMCFAASVAGFEAYYEANSIVSFLATTAFLLTTCVVALELRAMLLRAARAQMESTLQKILLHVRVVVFAQCFALFLLGYNLRASPAMLIELKRKAINGINGCASLGANYSKAYTYIECICEPVDLYLEQNCTRTANLALGLKGEALSTKGMSDMYDCKEVTGYAPYKDPLAACAALTFYRIHSFLGASATTFTYCLAVLWAAIEYNELKTAEERRLGRHPTWLNSVAMMVGRFWIVVVTFGVVCFSSAQFAAFSWYYERSTYIGIVHGMWLQWIMRGCLLLAWFGIAFDAIRRRWEALRVKIVGHDGFDCFLTHDWGRDELNRDNHERVSKINAALKARGFATWFDEQQLSGDINKQMADGIDRSKAVVVFVTSRYMVKVAGDGDAGTDDNCKYEFDYSLRRKGVEKMVPVVMEPRCRRTSDWPGVVGGKLGGRLYCDASTSDVDGPGTISNIIMALKNIGVEPSIQSSMRRLLLPRTDSPRFLLPAQLGVSPPQNRPAAALIFPADARSESENL